MRTVRAGTLLLTLLGLLALAFPAAAQDAKTYTQAQLDQLVGPIALYPDALLAQVLMASTYPLQVIEADRWVKANPNLKGQALTDALSKQEWDPSVISLCETPQLLDRMSQNLDWTQDLGNAFLAQEADVMATAQRLRQEANKNGTLQSNEQQKVVVQQETIVIQPANPQVVYVPSYDPAYMYGSAWGYPAPMYPGWYAPWPGSAFVRGLAWGAGFAIGHEMFGGCDWHGGSVNINNTVINNNNQFKNSNYNKNQNINRNQGGKQNWSHDASQRGNVRYGDNKTAQKYNRPNQSPTSRDQARGYDRGGQQGAGNRGGQQGAGAANRGGQGAGNVGQNRANTGGKQNAFAGSNNANFDRQASSRGAQSRNKPSSGMSSYGGGGSRGGSGGGASRGGGGASRGGGGGRRR